MRQTPPPPTAIPTATTRALIFDSIYDDYRGVIVYVRVIDGELVKGQKIRLMGTDKLYQITDLGKLMPRPKQVERIGTGEVGFLVAAIKDLHDVRIGDTVTDAANPAAEALARLQADPADGLLRFLSRRHDAIRRAPRRHGPPPAQRQQSFTFAPESSDALGFGFRCGFLGLLHMEIIQERLEREFHIEIVQTAPTVTYEIKTDRRHRHAESTPRANCRTQRTSKKSASRTS